MSPGQASAKRLRVTGDNPLSPIFNLSHPEWLPGREGSDGLAGLMIYGELSAGLFFGHIPDDWQLPHLPLIGLKQQDHPDYEARESDQRPDQNGQPTEERNMNNEAQHNPQRSPGNGEKDGLERVKTDEATLVIRFDHQEDDRWNNCDVSQHARNVVGEPARRGLSRSSCRSSGAAACWTNAGTIWCLSATHGTKCHKTIPLGIHFGMRPENGRTLAEMNRQGKRNRSGRGSAALVRTLADSR